MTRDELESIIYNVVTAQLEDYEDILAYVMLVRLKDGISSEMYDALEDSVITSN